MKHAKIMAIEVKVNVNFNKELAKLGQIEAALQKQLLYEAGRIKIRTQSGRSVDGGAFPRYSADYAKWRRKKGRKTRPDLVFTGAMQRAINVKITKGRDVLLGEIFFDSSAEAAKAKYNQQTRTFFGLAQEQFDRIRRAVNDLIKL